MTRIAGKIESPESADACFMSEEAIRRRKSLHTVAFALVIALFQAGYFAAWLTGSADLPRLLPLAILADLGMSLFLALLWFGISKFMFHVPHVALTDTRIFAVDRSITEIPCSAAQPLHLSLDNRGRMWTLQSSRPSRRKVKLRYSHFPDLAEWLGEYAPDRVLIQCPQASKTCPHYMPMVSSPARRIDDRMDSRPAWHERLVSHWPWTIPALIVTTVGIIAALSLALTAHLRFSDAAAVTMKALNESPRATRRLGQPIEMEFFITGRNQVHGRSGYAKLNIPVSGPAGRGVCFVHVVKIGDSWHFMDLQLTVDSEREPLALTVPEDPGRVQGGSR